MESGAGAQFGPYRLLRELGRGGMGVVYLAEDARHGRQVALKLLLAAGEGDVGHRQRFLREAQALHRLEHPNVVRVLDSGQVGGHLYLATEFVEGQTLESLVRYNGPLDVDRAVELVGLLAGALEAAHGQGIYHRDLKPENVLLDPGGNPKLVDFGIARVAGDQRLTRTGEVMGTPAYMPPEQASGEHRLHGEASDVYGLGATLYFLLTGEPPFSGTTGINVVNKVLSEPPRSPRSLRPDLDPGLERVILRALAKEPGERQASASELAEDLAASRTRREVPGAGRIAALALAALAVVFLVAGLALSLAPRPGQSPVGSTGGPPSSADPPPPDPAEPPVDRAPPRPPQPAEPSPGGEPWLRLDAAAVAAGALPTLECRDPLGISIAERGGRSVLRFRAQGRTRPELHLPLAWRGGAFRVSATLAVDLLETTNRFVLLLGHLDGQQAPVGIDLRCRGAMRFGEGGEELLLVAPPAPGELRIDPGVVPLFSAPLEAVFEFDPEAGLLTRRASVAGEVLLDDSVPFVLRPGPGGLLPLAVGANLLPGPPGRRPRGDPTSLVRVDLLRLELSGFDAGELPHVGMLARVRRANRALVGGLGREEARSLQRVPLRGLEGFEAAYLSFLLDPEGEFESLRGLWGRPDFQERWADELFLYSPAVRASLAELFAEDLVARYGEQASQPRWQQRYARHRVWGDKGGLKAPSGVDERDGAETLWLRGEWERAHAELAKAVLVYTRTPPSSRRVGVMGVALLYLGDLEGAEEVLDSRVTGGDQYMRGPLGEVAFRLGEWERALQVLEPYRGDHPLTRPRKRYYRERLEPLARRLIAARERLKAQ